MSKFINPIELKKQIQSRIQSVEPDLPDLTSKVQAVDKFTSHLFIKAHKCLFLFLIILCSLMGIPMLCLNYMSSLGNPQNLSSITPPTNTILLMFQNASTFSIVYYSQTNPQIQLFILLALLIFSLALLLLLETWLKYIPKVYKEKVVRIESYSLQITVRDKIKRKEIKEFTEYLDTYIMKCIKWKIAILENTQGKSPQERFLLNLLKEIAKKPTTIQDTIPLPFRTKDIPIELLDMREQSSHTIISVFTYPQVAQVALQWWQNKQNAQSIKQHILDVLPAPSTRNLLFDKFQNKGDYKNRVANADRYIFVAILWEFLFILLFCGTVWVGSMPGVIFSTDFKTSNEFMFKIGMVGVQGFLLFLHIRLYHQTFIPGYLLKSFTSIFTFEQQANRAITWSILLLVLDLFILPTCAHLFVDLAGFGFTFDNFKPILEDALYGQYGITNVLVCYCGLKHIISPFLKGFYRVIRKVLSKCRRCSQHPFEQQYATHYTSLFLQFTVLFCWSLFSSPVVACLSLLGVLFKLQEFCNVKQFKPNCLIAVCLYLEKLTFLIKYFLIAGGGIFMSNLLNGYILAVKAEFMNPLIIGMIGAAFILVLCIFMDKVEPNAFQRPVYFFFDSLPQKIQSKMLYNPQEQQKYQNTKVVLDQMTKAIVEKVYPNQQIFFNYNEQLRQNKSLFTSQLPELNRQDSAKKINQEMNTMSRSLQESLKNRLLAKPPNPFEIAPSTKEQQGQYSGIIYQDKVVMGPRKFKNVFIPLLQLPYGQRRSQPQPQNNPLIAKPLAQQLQRHNTAGQARQKQKPKRTYQQYNMAENQTNSWGDMMVHGTEIEQQQKKKKKSKENEKYNKQTEEREKKQREVAEELLQRKVKFTDLFDSDEESIKNLVKKKIKQSIPKLI